MSLIGKLVCARRLPAAQATLFQLGVKEVPQSEADASSDAKAASAPSGASEPTVAEASLACVV